ncbi:MAG: hypothetical protein ABTA16_03425 [Niallia sp.]
MEKLTTWLPHIKDIVNIAFFLTTGIVAVLTYVSAKKTILQPIKTEIFKEQIKEFSKTIELFYAKDELTLRNDYALDKLIVNNITLMIDSYAKLFFDVKLKEPEFMKKGIFSVTKKYAEENFEIAADYIQNDRKNEVELNPKPHESTKYSIWSSYHHGMLYIPSEFEEMDNKIKSLINNPLLPKDLIDLLSEYRSLSNDNAEKIRNIIEECSKEMPLKYVNEEQLMKFSGLWIEQKINNEIEHFEPQAKKIIRFLRDYYQSDNLMKK